MRYHILEITNSGHGGSLEEYYPDGKSLHKRVKRIRKVFPNIEIKAAMGTTKRPKKIPKYYWERGGHYWERGGQFGVFVGKLAFLPRSHRRTFSNAEIAKFLLAGRLD